MADVQSWPEVPSIAHFCSLFRAAFNLLDFDIEELEEALLTDGAEDSGSSLLQELIVRLLCGCVESNDISTFNYQMYLRRLFRQKCQEYGRENPFNTDIDFQFLPLRVKVEILHALCDFRLDASDVPDLLRNLESDSLRVEPLGHDESKSAYWYFYGTRLYREDFPKLKKKIKERKKRRKEDKRRRRTGSESDLDIEEPGAGVWQVVCFTEADWVALASKLKGSSCKAERELYRTLIEDFLPEIPRLFAEKERQQRRRVNDYQPRRQSTRLEKLKQKEERDEMPQLEDETGRSKDRERRRRNSRRSSESGWEESVDSADEDVEEEDEEESREREPKSAGASGKPAGRQTNNSLSSATGPIIIQPTKKKKLKGKQVFKTTVEDLRTGMYKILEYVKSQEDAWPFISPVDENYAPRYYSVIRRPMDLRRMEEKLDSGEYLDLNYFRDDFQLIVDNCRQYNGSENEYTEMVNNLLEAFNEAVDRYLESDPSSDEEGSNLNTKTKPEPVRHVEKKSRERKESGSGSKRSKVKRKRREKERLDSASESEFDEPPALKPQRDRSSGSEISGSIPGSDFDELEPDFLRETSPPKLEKAESDSDSPHPRPKRKVKGRSRRGHVDSGSDTPDIPIRRPGRGRLRRGATASDSDSQQAPKKARGAKKQRSPPSSESDNEPVPVFLKAKPKQAGENSDSDSQSRPMRNRHSRAYDLENLAAVTEETLKSITSMLEDTPLASGFSSASNSPHHLIDDFPPEPPKPPTKPERHFRNPRDSGRRRKPLDLLRPIKRKDIRTIDRLQPGKSKGNLIGNLPKPKDPSEENSMSLGLGGKVKESRNALLVKTDETGPKLSLGTVLKSDVIDFGKSKHNFDSLSPEVKDEKDSEADEKIDASADENKSPVRLNESSKVDEALEDKDEDTITNKENDPKVEKPKEIVASGDTDEKKRDAVKEITNKATPNASAWFKAFGAPKAPAAIKKKIEVAETPPVVEEKEATWGSTSIPVAPARRQRKASSSSSVSEPSSLSQDSPLHPVSPGLISPRGEPPPPPMNGTLRVGFYQDMSSVHKSSPEKQSPRSSHSSPRELSNPSPFQQYSHVYPPSSPGVYSSYTASAAAPQPSPQQPQQMSPSPQPQPPSPSPIPPTFYDNVHQYPAYTEQYRQPVRTLENYNSYKPPDPAPKPNPSIFPVKKRLYTSVEAPRTMDVPKDTQPPQSEMLVGRDMYKESVDRYSMDVAYQQRAIGPYGTNPSDGKPLDVPRLHQPEQDPMMAARLQTSQPDLSRLSMPPSHTDVLSMGLVDNKLPKYPGPERSLNAMIEGLARMPSPARGFPSSLERLMQPPSIQEDSDGVFRNKFAVDTSYQAQRHQPPVSSAYPSHMVDRYDEERLSLSNAYYDKNLYLKNVAPTSNLPMYADPTPPNPQSGYELNIPKARDPKAAGKRKKTVKSQETGGQTAFQQYVGLKASEPSVMKPTAPVPGSAFNFGPGLNSPLYSEGYLEDLRQPGAYYGMVGSPAARGASYPLPQYMGHQQGLVDGYQQYLQRVQEEQLRHSLAYPPGYHPALGIRPTYDRPSWL